MNNGNSRGSRPSRLAPEWRRWLLESLLSGVEPAELVPALVKAGVGAARAKAAIRAEVQGPHFRGGYRAVSMQRKVEGLVAAFSHLHRHAPGHDRVERRAGPSARELRRALALRSHPLIVRDAFPALQALGLSARRPRLRYGARRARGPLRPARRDLLLYQVSGAQRLQLVPWYEYLAVAARAGRSPRGGGREPVELEVQVEAGEALLLPVGWWYRLLGREGGVAVTFQLEEAGTGADWRGGRPLREASRPPPAGPPLPRRG